VFGILTCIRRLTGLCLQSLHHRFVVWAKPGPTSLMLGTLTDLVRSKHELVAENALLRQQLIILHRQVKRPACTKTDRMLLVLLARAGRDLEASAFYRSARDAPALASAGIQALLEIQVQSTFCQTKDLCRDRGFDQGDGKQQSALGSRTYSWRIT
jgi:hypothetical protein